MYWFTHDPQHTEDGYETLMEALQNGTGPWLCTSSESFLVSQQLRHVVVWLACQLLVIYPDQESFVTALWQMLDGTLPHWPCPTNMAVDMDFYLTVRSPIHELYLDPLDGWVFELVFDLAGPDPFRCVWKAINHVYEIPGDGDRFECIEHALYAFLIDNETVESYRGPVVSSGWIG